MKRTGLMVGVVWLAACASSADRATDPGFVSSERLASAAADSGNWLMYSGTYDGQRYSRLDAINGATVSRMEPKWSVEYTTVHPNETTPLVVDGIMYATRPPNDVVAIDTRTGVVQWQFEWPVPADLTPLCCGWINRGVAILGRTLYLGTLDAHLVALDADTGRQKWVVRVADYSLGFNISAAPLVVKDMVLTGTSLAMTTALSEAFLAGLRLGMTDEQMARALAGQATPEELAAGPDLLYEHREAIWAGTEPRRGRLDAYDAETGELRWRTFTVPAPGEPHHESWEGDSWRIGGASTWMTGSYDPVLDLVYWGVGNPSPALFGDLRRGDNLYAASMLALRPEDGSVAWHFQFTPHDTHDWDGAQVPVLVDLEGDGGPRRLLLNGNRNGFFYVLDRVNGALELASPFARQNWAVLDDTGRPVARPDTEPRVGGVRISPTADGATSWWSPAYHPGTGLFYVTAHDATENYDLARAGTRLVETDSLVSAVRAIDPLTGRVVWEFILPLRSTPGLLTTAGNLIFLSGTTGEVWALDAATGAIRWRGEVEGWMHAAPITYLVDGEQRLTVASSTGLYTFGLPGSVGAVRP